MTKITEMYDKEIKSYSDAMRYKLHVNRHKGKWEGATLEGLFAKLKEEIQELHDEIDVEYPNHIAVMLESADIGNIAMMIANIALKAATGEHYEESLSRDEVAAKILNNSFKPNYIRPISDVLPDFSKLQAPHLGATEEEIGNLVRGSSHV